MPPGRRALYCRLSRDDGYLASKMQDAPGEGYADDSCSIDSQKSMLKEYALNQGFERCEFFIDDGYSGSIPVCSIYIGEKFADIIIVGGI